MTNVSRFNANNIEIKDRINYILGQQKIYDDFYRKTQSRDFAPKTERKNYSLNAYLGHEINYGNRNGYLPPSAVNEVYAEFSPNRERGGTGNIRAFAVKNLTTDEIYLGRDSTIWLGENITHNISSNRWMMVFNYNGSARWQDWDLANHTANDLAQISGPRPELDAELTRFYQTGVLERTIEDFSVSHPLQYEQEGFTVSQRILHFDR